jgi:hypothetical protein
MTNQNGYTIVQLDELTITVSPRQPDGSFTAWFGDYDLDCMTGWGGTVVAAASDLLDVQNDRRITKLTKSLGA